MFNRKLGMRGVRNRKMVTTRRQASKRKLVNVKVVVAQDGNMILGLLYDHQKAKAHPRTVDASKFHRGSCIRKGVSMMMSAHTQTTNALRKDQRDSIGYR